MTTSRTQNWVKRAAACVVVFSLVIGFAYGPFATKETPRAHAQFTVIDPTNLVQNTINAAASVDSVVVSKVLNGLAWSVAKLTVQSITRSTVNWINSGFQGSPAFVTDLQSNLKYLGDAVANNFFEQLNSATVDATGFNLKSPFQDQISQQLRTEYYKQTSGLLGLSAYDLSGHSADPKAFINGTFSQGGFNAFFSASQNPANNPIGAYKLASEQLKATISAADEQRKTELQWGQGFLSWRGDCPATAAGSSAKDSLSLSKAEPCPFSTVRTPGSVIVAAAPKAIQSGLDSLQAADSINEIVGALMGQLVNKVLGGGGLLGVSQPTSGGGSSYLNQATDPSQLNGAFSSISNGVLQNLENDRTSITNFQKQWGIIMGAANKAQTSCGVRPEITTVTDQGNKELLSATKALAAVTTQENSIKAATNSTSANKSQLISDATISYQSYLSNPIISPTEFGEAAIQSQESSTSSPSLYTKMTTLAASCVVR